LLLWARSAEDIDRQRHRSSTAGAQQQMGLGRLGGGGGGGADRAALHCAALSRVQSERVAASREIR